MSLKRRSKRSIARLDINFNMEQPLKVAYAGEPLLPDY
jgi:hypothetical protein